MSTGWYRSARTGSAHIVHEGRCPRMGTAHQWVMVEGWPAHEVLARVAEVPWLRLCGSCADRLNMAGDDPARFSENDTGTLAG